MGSGVSKVRAKYDQPKASKDLIKAAKALTKKVEGRGMNLSEEDTIRLHSSLGQEATMPLQVSENVRLTPAAVKRLIKSEKDQQVNLMPGDLAEIIEIGDKEHVVDLRSADLGEIFRLPDGETHALLLSRVKPGDRVEIFSRLRRRWEPATVKTREGDTVVAQYGSKVRVRGPERPELAGRTGIEIDDETGHPLYWYEQNDVERPPPNWSLMRKAEVSMGVGDRNFEAKDIGSWENARKRNKVTVEIDQLTATKSSHYKAPVWSGDRTAVRERAIAEENVDAAHNYMNSGKFDAALDCLNRALDYHPDRAMVHATRGSCFVFTEQLQDALREYQTASELKPDDGAYMRGLGMTKFYLGRAMQAEHGEDFTGTNSHLLEAEDHLEQAVELGYDKAQDDLEFVRQTNREQMEALAQRKAEDPNSAIQEEQERLLRKAQEAVALESREEAEAAAENAMVLREEAEARLAQEGAVQEWADVEYAQRLVDAAELELLRVRDNPDARMEAQQRLEVARNKLHEKTKEAKAAEARAEMDRHEADVAEARAKRDRLQAEEWHELVHGQGEASEKQQHLRDIRDHNTAEHRVANRQRPLDESDVAAGSLVRLSAFGVHKLMGEWLPGEEQPDESLVGRRVNVKGKGVGRVLDFREEEKKIKRTRRTVFVHKVEMEDTLAFPKPTDLQLRSRGNDGLTGCLAFQVQVAGKRGCLDPGDVGKVVMLSSQIPKDPMHRRVRVQGPSVVRYDRRSDGTEVKNPRSGSSAFYEQRELERPPLAKMHDEDLPSGLDIHYLKYMKDLEVQDRRKELLCLDNKALAVEAIKAGAAQTEDQRKRLLLNTKEQLVEMVVEHETGYYARLGAKHHVKAKSTTGVPSETKPSTSDFDEDPVAIQEGDVNSGVRRVTFEKQEWSVAFQTPGKDLAVAKRIGGGQEQLRKQLLALPFYQPEPKLLRKELSRLGGSELSKQAVAKCSATPIEVKWLVKRCECSFSYTCQWCDNLPKEKLVDLILTNPSTIQKAIAVAIGRWKGLDATEIMENLASQLHVLQKEDLIDQIGSIHYYIGDVAAGNSRATGTKHAEEVLISSIISHSTVVQRALLQSVTKGAIRDIITRRPTSKEMLEKQLVDIGDKEKVVNLILANEIGPMHTFSTDNWETRLEVAQKEADEKELAEAKLTDEQLGIRKDIGDAFTDFFNDGITAAVLDPAKFDIRRSYEDDIREREQDHGLAREMIDAQYATSEDEVNRMAKTKSEFWRDELIKLDKQHHANVVKREFQEATKAMSMTDVMKAGRDKAAEKARIARQEERKLRQQAIKGASAAEAYAQRQEELSRSRQNAAQERRHTKIHEHARQGDLEQLNLDPQKLASHLELPNMFGETPLICAASEGHTGAVVFLLGIGAKVDVVDDDGMTPLMWACASKTPNTVKALLEHGALVTPVDSAGQNAMDWAACKDLVASDVSAKREAMRNERKRRWGASGKVTEVIERVGADWKSGWAAPSGENWSLTTWLGPARGTKLAMDPEKAPAESRAEINKATGMLKHADFTTYRVARPDFREYPAFGHDSAQVLTSQNAVGRNWDRLNRYDGILKDTKVYEAVLRGEHIEDVMHDIAWHEMTNILVTGGDAMISAFVDTLVHCRETLGYAISVAAFSYEREALTVLRDRIQDLVRILSGTAAGPACEIIAMLPEKDDTSPNVAPTEVEKLELGMDRTARTRRKLASAVKAPPALTVQQMEIRARERAAEKIHAEEADAAKRKSDWEAVQAEYSAADNLPDLPALADGELDSLDTHTGSASPLSSRPTSNCSSRPASRHSADGSRPHSRHSDASTTESNSGQLTLRIFAHLLVAADGIPGRHACNATSVLVREHAELNRKAEEAEKSLLEAKNHLQNAEAKCIDASTTYALAAEAHTVAEEHHKVTKAVVDGLLLKEGKFRDEFKEPPAELKEELDVANMAAVQARITLKNKTQDANVTKAAYDQMVKDVHEATRNLHALEKRSEAIIEESRAKNIARVESARTEWRQDWKALEVQDCIDECKRLGLEFVESDGVEILQTRLASHTAATLSLALVERLEVLLIDLYDTDGLRAFLKRQIGPELFLQVYTNLREVDRAVYVRGVHWDTTAGFLQDKFSFFGRIESLRLIPRVGSDGSNLRSEAVIIFEDAAGASAANDKGSWIIQESGVHFRTYDQEFAEQQVRHALDQAGKLASLPRLERLIAMDIEEAVWAVEMAKPKEQRERERIAKELAAAEAAAKIRLEEQAEKEARELAEREEAQAQEAKEYGVKEEIFDMLNAAMGWNTKLSKSMEARKAARNEKWGLTDAGTKKKKEKPLPPIDTPEGAKLYNLVTSCVKAARMVTARDLRDTFSEEELIKFLGMQSGAAASTKLELAKWFLPVAERYWEEICDALAIKGRTARKAGAGAGRSKSTVWKKARSEMVLRNAFGKSTPQKELSVRSAAARGDRKAVNACLREGANMNVANDLGWTAYHYAVHNGHPEVAKLLLMAGCDETDVPYLSPAEKLTAKQYKVVERSMIREDCGVDSAAVGFVEVGDVVYVTKLVVENGGSQRARLDRGWVTVMGNAALQSDARTKGAARLVPLEDKNSDALARGY